jgi:hypothetical protein
MLKSKAPALLLMIFVIVTAVPGQDNRRDRNDRGVQQTQDQFETYSQLPEKDYRIISSNTSHIEIEFYPQFTKPENVVYGNGNFTRLSFENAGGYDVTRAGEPDLRFRAFPVILPSEDDNLVTLIDYDVNEVKNINLVPVAGIEFKNPKDRSFENIVYTYKKNAAAYSKNNFLPEGIAKLSGTGTVREIILTSLVIHPYQYNPVTKVLKQYTRIKVRVNFSRQPVYLNRKRSYAENELLKDIAVNSEAAVNWMNPTLPDRVKPRITENSVLATGDWYRIEIRDNGDGKSDAIYKMSKTFLEGAGINLSSVDPRTIKMYGNGGELLPEGLEDPRPQDLVQIPIYIDGEDDGRFDTEDFILFYGKSINKWKYSNVSSRYDHFVNYYSRSNYYFICLNTSGSVKRMIQQHSENVQNPERISSFSETLFIEPETSNLINEGNLWLSGRLSSGQSHIWNNSLTGLEANTAILYRIKPASRVVCPLPPTPCTYENNMLLKEDHSTMSEIFFQMDVVYPGYGNWIWTDTTSFVINSSQMTGGEQSKFRATFITNAPDGEGYVDWMEIQYKRRLTSVTNDYVRINAPDISGTIEYNVSPFSGNNIKVFDVTLHEDVRIILPLASTASNVKFQKSQGLLSKFFVIGPNGYRVPASISQRIPNQNLHGGYSEGASFIIITHKDFLSAANRLKGKREAPGPGNPNYLKTRVFDVQSVYNEFSGGVLDAVAIRDFLKHCYESWQEKPVYVCFFGDGSFDYKSIITPFSSWVPAFEITDPNINQVSGYTTDDFYVNVTGINGDRPDIASGRIPVNSIEDANAYLDKIDCYENPVTNGTWKNKVAFVADDGTTTAGPESSEHTDQCEDLAENFAPATLDKYKFYLVTYPTVITSQGRRKPGVNADIIKYWNNGIIAMHYTGHGSPEVWAHEYVFEKDVVISQLNNKCKYPFVSVASCDFSKFDNPLSTSGGELLTIAPLKAAIGTLAATRPVYSTNNWILSNTFWSKLYIQRDTLRLQQRFGKALFQTKNTMMEYGTNEKKYILLCEPATRTQVPRFLSRIDSINGLRNDTMSALSKIKIFGSIIHADSLLWADYNGKIYLKIFDVVRTIRMYDEHGILFVFKLPGNIIYSGSLGIKNGKWTAEFIVPKDISYLNERGKLINYFYNNQADGSSLYTGFIVGGINPNAAIDTTGPDIKLFLNTRNFRSGDVVNENFKLIADLFDESGINTTGTIGHKIEAVLDNNENVKYDLSNFYVSDSSYKYGTLEYDFNSISEGKHRLRLKVWDTYNNSSEQEVEFSVSVSTALMVTHVYNYPNPFGDKTAFTFQHNFGGPINVDIKIYTVAGRLIKVLKRQGITDKFVVIEWYGRDEDDEAIANGLYIYKLTVNSENGSSETTTGKLAVVK